MIPVIQETLYFIVSYVGIIIFIYLSLNFLSKGWLTAFIKVRGSRGKKVMTIIHSVTDTYFRPGMFKADGAYHYKTRSKTSKVLTKITREEVFPMMGVFCLTVNESTDEVYTYKGQGKAAIDAATADNLIKRIIMAPHLQKDYVLWVLFIVILIVLIQVGGIYWQTETAAVTQALCSAARVI